MNKSNHYLFNLRELILILHQIVLNNQLKKLYFIYCICLLKFIIKSNKNIIPVIYNSMISKYYTVTACFIMTVFISFLKSKPRSYT